MTYRLRNLNMTNLAKSNKIKLLTRLALAAVLAVSPGQAATQGPDAQGYTGTDSVVYSFIDISGGGGGSSVLGGTDDGAAALTLPFGFNFYGTSYSVICASTNGAVYFTTDAATCTSFNNSTITDFSNTDLSSSVTPADLPAIFPFWSDLSFADAGSDSVYYATVGASGNRRFIIQWNNVVPGGSSAGITFQVVLAEGTNSITVQYKNVALGSGDANTLGGNATVGIRDAGGQGTNKYIQWSFNSQVLTDASALVFQTSAAPSAPTLTAPADTATGVLMPVTLTWNPAPAATSYDVHFGTSNPPGLVTNVVATSHAPATAVSTTYFWRIVARNTSGSTPSPVQSFTTQACTYTLGTSTVNTVIGGATTPVTVTTLPGCAWTVTGAPSWLTFSGGSNTGTGSGTTTLVIAANTGAARSASLSVSGTALTVNQTGTTTPGGGVPATISWSAPAAIAYGTPLSGLQLNATANVPGNFLYSPNLGAILNAGQQILTANFTPSQQGFIASQASVSITVLPSPQTITFAPLSDKTTDDSLFSISATASSQLPVVFSVLSGPAIITGNGNTVQINGPGPIEIQASQPGGGNFGAAVPVIRKFNVKLGNVKISAILNAASYANAALAGNGYAVVFGSAFAEKDFTAAPPLPAELGGASVTITDSAGKSASGVIYYADFNQINFVVPEGLAGGPASVAISNASGKSATWAVNLASVAPALFSSDSSGKGAAAAVVITVGPDKTVTTSLTSGCTVLPLVCKPIPIDLGPPGTEVFLSFYGTGIRGGRGVPGVSVLVGGQELAVTYAGAQASFPGLDQVNVQLSRSLIGKGEVDVRLTIDGIAANPLRISIK